MSLAALLHFSYDLLYVTLIKELHGTASAHMQFIYRQESSNYIIWGVSGRLTTSNSYLNELDKLEVANEEHIPYFSEQESLCFILIGNYVRDSYLL